MSSPSFRSLLIPRLSTLALALAGAVTFWLLGLPLPFLFGPMSFCLIAALAGAPLRGLGQISVAARTILGVAVGASITPAVIAQIPQMALSVALVPLYVLLIGLIGVPFFRRLGFDPVTSYYAAMPGGLQDMVIFGQEAGADVRALSLIHATRVAVLVTIVPVILVGLYDAPLTGAMGKPMAQTGWDQLALMVAAALIGWKGAERIGLFGASILGPMIVTTALSLAGIITTRPPAEAIMAAQLFIGIGIGVNYVGVTLRELRQFVLSGLAFVVVLAVLATAFTEFVVLTGLARPLEGFLAFAPGGQAELTVLAIVVGADLGFVILHHLTRIVVVITGAPIMARLMGIRAAKEQ
ncbi:MAG: AbrB family transcriptional regulator [Paracoccus sp. (in: a-proteobacteria)]|uniref:AbrB family transcriptional regulator n=1 Tax=Paracoccus sp. TaxID=267 RepID=UPI0026E0018F|nr:AbrB family transcriptional regulator [Paracoccus sp. (in: a-proteobacteria)]MDO5630254.1 AbrB family transcriptional regulator [Paracoccus sp. (in: a-proteobacteria)]